MPILPHQKKLFLFGGGDRGRGADLVGHHCYLTRFEVNPVYSHEKDLSILIHNYFSNQVNAQVFSEMERFHFMLNLKMYSVTSFKILNDVAQNTLLYL